MTTQQEKKFIVDQMYRRLAHWLRLLGYDTLFSKRYVDQDYIQLAKRDNRQLLTRDDDLKARAKKEGIKVITVAGKTVEKRLMQLAEQAEIELEFNEAVLPRCTTCNSTIKEVPKAEIEKQLKAGTRKHYNQFWICENEDCKQIYWHGSHWEKMMESLTKSKAMLEKKRKEQQN